MKRSAAILVLTSFTSLFGCVPPEPLVPSPFGGDVQPLVLGAFQVMVEVRNEHWLPMRVWVEWPKARQFLGDVAPGAVNQFAVSGDLARRWGRFQLYADPTGSIDAVRTEPIDLRGGRRIEWRLRKNLASSTPRVI